MKISVKPSILLLFSFILGYIGLFLPITKIQYQVLIDGGQPNITNPKIVTNEVLAGIFSDEDGDDIIPCTFPRLEPLPNSPFGNLLRFWLWVGKLLCAFPLYWGYSYVVDKKIPLLKFFALAVIFFVGPVVISLVFFRDPTPATLQPICNPYDLYKISSFTPYWPTLLILLIGNLIGYHATRLINGTNMDATIEN